MPLPKFVKPLDRRDYVLTKDDWDLVQTLVKRRLDIATEEGEA